MVFCSGRVLVKSKNITRKYMREGFRDSLKVFVCGGTGGNGLPKYGGIGGQGGNVVAVGNTNTNLNEVYQKNKSKNYIAKDGKNSTHNFILGPAGTSLKFEVPVGVSIYTELGKKIGEVNQEGEELILAKGGTGGNQKNGYLGTKGQAYSVILDLKLIADIGLVGFPNAGKSTLLKAISHAKPRIASYPFTTIRPNVGIIKYQDFREISVADLPGLIEGAHANKGMGHRFLKHVERTKLLLFMVDINGFQLSPQYPHRSCLETILLLNKELELYNPELLKKPIMILINKMDTAGAKEKYMKIKNKINNLSNVVYEYSSDIRAKEIVKFIDVLAISAKENLDDIEMVKKKLRRVLDILNELEHEESLQSDVHHIKELLVEKGSKLV